jgi:tRNA A-37 threonylcarbamoyl transferase component Bud32/lipoprotein NlpI
MNSTEQENYNEKIIDLLIQLGMTYLEKGDYDNSIDKFKKVIELGEANAKGYLNLSKVYILKEQFDDESQQIFEKSLEFEPENPVLNVILSQIYLDAGREDDQAMKVFLVALKHNPGNADALRAKLIKISFQQGDIDIARELMQQFIGKPEKISNYLPFYIVNEWKHQGFNRVTQYLKKAIKVQGNTSFYRWLIVNFLQAEEQSLEPFELSAEDLNLCHNYLNELNSFDQLLDIYLYPAIERMLVKHSKNLKKASSRGIDEYEVFLAENALSNIWEKGLNKKDIYQNSFIPKEGSVWKKLKPWYASENDIDADNRDQKKEKTVEIYNQAETILVMRLKGATSNEVNETLTKSLSAISEIEKTFIGGFQSNDGFILFWKDVNSPVRMAVNFIQDQSVENRSNLNNQGKIQFLVHKLSRRAKDKEKNITYDLQLALSPFQLEREMFFQDNHSDQLEQNSRFQLFVTSALKEKINGDSQFSLEPIELSVQHPTTEESIQIFQLSWDDSLAKIKQGKIQEIGCFKLLKEINQNQVFSSFKAVDSFLDRLVIMKILNPYFKLDNNQNSTVELFFQETKILGKLLHPNISLVYDIGNDQNFCFFAREYVEGIPLAVQKSINKKINVNKTLEIFHNIAQTLSFIHEQNIFHGKLQPNNIFVLNNNEIKITDFQLPSFASPLRNFQTPSLKCLTYSAPEQIDNKVYDNLTDIFSMGVMMYEMLTDHNPFYDTDRDKIFENILNKNPQPPTSYNPELPNKLDYIILKTLEKSPEKRYQTIGELEKKLLKVIE